MAICDNELATALSSLVKYLNENRLSPGNWIPQVTLVYPDKDVICVLQNGLPDDPIAALEKFGEAQTRDKELRAAIVIAESVNDELMVSSTDSTGETSMAYVGYCDGKWSVLRDLNCERLRGVDTARIPSVAVWTGIKRESLCFLAICWLGTEWLMDWAICPLD